MRPSIKGRLRNEIVPTIAVVVATVGLGVGVAFAAIGGVGAEPADPATRTLSSAPGITLQHAYGASDEDCLYATQQTMLPDGQQHPMRQLVCYQ